MGRRRTEGGVSERSGRRVETIATAGGFGRAGGWCPGGLPLAGVPVAVRLRRAAEVPGRVAFRLVLGHWPAVGLVAALSPVLGRLPILQPPRLAIFGLRHRFLRPFALCLG